MALTASSESVVDAAKRRATIASCQDLCSSMLDTYPGHQDTKRLYRSLDVCRHGGGTLAHIWAAAGFIDFLEHMLPSSSEPVPESKGKKATATAGRAKKSTSPLEAVDDEGRTPLHASCAGAGVSCFHKFFF